MQIELSGTVRGEQVAVQWCDGDLDGSDELLRRLEPLVSEGRCDTSDLSSVIRAIELIAAQRMHLRVLDGRRTHRSSTLSR